MSSPLIHLRIRNLVSFMGFGFGFLAALSVVFECFQGFVASVFMSVICDYYDGVWARWCDRRSGDESVEKAALFGMFLDALNDAFIFVGVVSFGALSFTLREDSNSLMLNSILCLSVGLYCLAGLLRLGHFLTREVENALSYQGLPSTDAAWLCVIFLYVFADSPATMSPVVFILAMLMIAPFSFPKLEGKAVHLITLFLGLMAIFTVFYG